MTSLLRLPPNCVVAAKCTARGNLLVVAESEYPATRNGLHANLSQALAADLVAIGVMIEPFLPCFPRMKMIFVG